MLPSLYIENFRLFDTLTIKRLGRVNLIVGRNNAGKSAFLEAVWLYVSNASLSAIEDIIIARQENYGSDSRNYPNLLSSNPVRHFFKGHKIPDLTSPGFTIAIKENEAPLTVKTAAFIVEESIDKKNIRKIEPEELQNSNTSYFDDVDIFVISEKNNVTQRYFSEERGFLPITARNSFKIELPSKPCLFVSTQGLTDTKAAELWDAISLQEPEKDVLESLKFVEKSIVGLAFVVGDRRERVPVVKLANQNERLPLKSLGDGVTRVFHIILALVNAKGGVLLIDEFENGLHWTVQQSVWEVLFRLAETLDVQVFCTTHSRDCIAGFGKVWTQYPQTGAFFRLYNRNQSIFAEEYDIEALADSLETDVEVR